MKKTTQDKFCNVGIIEPDKTLEQLYAYVSQDAEQVDHMYQAMSLSPKVIKPIHDLYLALLHDDESPISPWLAELLSVQVAVLNECSYALTHHGANFHARLNQPETSAEIFKAVKHDNWAQVLEDAKLIAILDFGKKLTLEPDKVNNTDLDRLREQGLTEKEIVYIAQIVSAFAYWTRILNALGVEVAGEKIGLE